MPRRSAAGPTLLLFLTLITTIPVPLCADDLLDARALELDGDTISARELYIRWISDHPAHEDIADVLIHAASLSLSPLDAIGILEEFLISVPETDIYRVYARLAALESSVGLPKEASIHYQYAARIGGAEGERWRLDSLALRFGMGDYAEVRQDALSLIGESETDAIRDEATSLAVLSLALEGRSEEALDEIQTYLNNADHEPSPLAWLALKEIAQATGSEASYRRALMNLDEHHPRSVIHYMAESRVLEWVSPSSLLTKRMPPELASVQTGAFARRDGAMVLRERLESDGFTAWIEEGGGLWRVYVNDPDGYVASRLQAKGYQASLR